MSFKKLTSDGRSQSFYDQDRGKPIQLSSGQSPVNDNGTTYDNSIQLNWPRQRFTIDNELNPKSNIARPNPSYLSDTPQTFGDFSSKSDVSVKSPTLG